MITGGCAKKKKVLRGMLKGFARISTGRASSKGSGHKSSVPPQISDANSTTISSPGKTGRIINFNP